MGDKQTIRSNINRRAETKERVLMIDKEVQLPGRW
jgi:hypothetical protein